MSDQERSAIVKSRINQPFALVYNVVLDKHGPTIGAYGLAVYLVLCRYSFCTKKTDLTSRQIAKYIDVSHSTVLRSIKLLEAQKLIEWEVKSTKIGEPSVIVLLDPNPEPGSIGTGSAPLPGSIGTTPGSIGSTNKNKSLESKTPSQSMLDLEGLSNPPKPPKEKKPVDPRHEIVRSEIQSLWLKNNPGAPTAPWYGPELSALKRLLDANKTWTHEQFIRCVRNRFASEENHSEQPRAWIKHLPNYFRSPLDRFGKPLVATVPVAAAAAIARRGDMAEETRRQKEENDKYWAARAGGVN